MTPGRIASRTLSDTSIDGIFISEKTVQGLLEVASLVQGLERESLFTHLNLLVFPGLGFTKTTTPATPS